MKKSVRSTVKVDSAVNPSAATAVVPAAVPATTAAQPALTEATPSVVVAPAAPAAPPSTVVTTMADPAVQECLSLLGQVEGLIGQQPALSSGDVRRSTKMRKGGSDVVPKILALCQQHEVTQVGTLTASEMSDQLTRGNALLQVGVQADLVQKAVKDAAMTANGRSWQIATTMYTTLQRLAADDPQLALGLVPIQGFFQTKRTKGQVRQNAATSEQKKLAKKQALAQARVDKANAALAALKAQVAAGSPAATAPAAGAQPAAAASPAAATVVNGASH